MPYIVELDGCQADLAGVVEDVFRTMISTEVSRLPKPEPATDGLLTAEVQFVGPWRGAILLQCGERQALAFTRALMPGREPTHIDEDVCDSLGELANMVGGNLKSMLPHGVALSRPAVVQGDNYAVHICGGDAVKTVSFSSEAGVFSVSLVHMRGPKTGD